MKLDLQCDNCGLSLEGEVVTMVAVSDDKTIEISIKPCACTGKPVKPIKIPWGIWDKEGYWYPNPNVDATPEQQREWNLKQGIECIPGAI